MHVQNLSISLRVLSKKRCEESCKYQIVDSIAFLTCMQIQVSRFVELMKDKANIYVESFFTNVLCVFISGGRTISDVDSNNLAAPLSTSPLQNNGMYYSVHPACNV